MSSFFQPGPSQEGTTTTPSPAQQAEQKFRIEMLGRILSSMGGTAPSFASFAAGGPAQRSFPSGFEGDIASLLNAMNQPGAFTSQANRTFQGPTPSGISDITQLASLLYLLSQASGLGLGDILKPIGGALGIGGTNPSLGDTTPSLDLTQFQGSNIDPTSLGSILGAGDPSLLPPGYGVLDTSGTDPAAFDWLNTY